MPCQSTNGSLPEHQWFEVCTQLVHGVPNDTVTGVNLGLSFMNSGSQRKRRT